jgi:putative ABC transport system permease protein
VALQFAVSIAMIVCTAVIWGQTAYLRNADIGYEREGLILVSGLEEVPDRLAALDDAFRQLPGVAGVTMSTRAPGDSQVLTARATRPGGRDQEMRYEMTGADYFRTYGIRIVSGRDFDNAHRADDIAGSKMAELQARGANIIVNERAARLLGYRSAGEAAGASIDFSGIPSTIIGVARDTRFGSPREPVAPVIYMRNTNDGRFAVIRHRGDGATMMRRLEAAWRQAAPGTPFQAATLEQTLAAFYEPDERRSRLFAAGAVLAVLIGCIGLYGLASFTADRRTKEIGLRKVLGAAAMDILRLLVVQFMRPVVLANLIAWPLAFLLMRAWLSGFDQSISLSPVYFLLATGAALAVALTTIIGEAYKLARADPVQALRHE